ncbi:MAG: PAS domain S-box protein [Methanofollis sp.]|uniref:PAS domain S-box protein n=1 Tax=Methanofollis sp. TaxID=2052835 RepID=UPI00260CE62D|nr:PAS domain S-box protein [Methanofollis sp.]MDD4254094.1 PAS domain S-box protein [Methanofollis sp.]
MISLLLVDDEPALLDIGKVFLEECGDLCVDMATTVAEAREKLRSGRYEAVVSDYDMPDVDGITFLKEIRLHHPDLPFILFTGKGREKVVIEALNSGADFYLQKGGDPVAQFAELSHKIRQAVQRRRVEYELRKSEKKYRELVDNLPETLFKMDIEGNLVYINRRGLEVLGLPEGEVYGKPWYFHVHPDDREDAEETCIRLIRTGGRAWGLELRVQTRSDGGKTISVLLNLTPIRDDAGRLLGAQGIAIDISGKKQAEIALQEAEERYRLITEGIADGVTLGNMGGIISYASPSMTRITGYGNGEIVCHSFREFVAEDDQEIIDACFEKTLHNRECFEGFRTRVKRKDGNCIYVEINGGPIIRDGEVIGAQSVTRDITRQLQTENALRESEERLNVTLRSIGDGVIVTGEDGRVTLINTVAESLTGWKEEEAMGKSLAGIFHIIDEKNSQPLENPVMRVIRHGMTTGHRIHTILVSRDSVQRVIASSAAPVRDKEGIIVGAVLVFRDVTAEREAEKARRRLAAIVESSDDAIFGTTVEGIITEWNRGAERIYRYADHEVIGRHVSMLAPRDRREEFMDAIREILHVGHKDTFETVRVRRDGEEIHIAITISPIRDEEGAITGFSAISRDITSQKEAEHALNKSRQWLEHVVEGVRLGTWECDMQTEKVTLNRHLAAMLGYPQDCLEADGQTIGQLISEADRAPVEEAVVATLAGLSPIFVQEVHLTGDAGRTVLLQAWGTVMERDESGRPVRLSGICQDISEIRGYQEAIKKANKKLNLLNSITRHDLLNQTTALQGYMTLINRAAGDGEPVIKNYSGICSRLIDTIQRQVVFTRDYENMGVHAPAWQHVGDAVRKVAADLSRGTGKVSILADTGDIEIYADPMFEKVLFNLFDNAIRHGERVTEIRVSFRANGDGGVLTVEDNGIGIVRDSRNKIFLAGYGRNTGYGLFLAKEILDITGIGIAETGDEGRGARFEMAVPERGYRMKGSGTLPAGS